MNLSLELVGAWNFENLVEDSDTCSLSPVIFRREYLFALQFWYCELCAKNRLGGGRKLVLLVFVPWRCFNRQWVIWVVMMMMMMMNCFCIMVDRRKAFSLVSNWDHCQRSSPSRISDMLLFFPTRILVEAISMAHSDMLYWLNISMFYFHEPLLLQIFITCKFIKQ